MNSNPGVLVVFMIFAIPLALIIGGVFLAALKILKGPSRPGYVPDESVPPIDEAVLIQEIHSSLTRMEKRIEALETILLERQPPIPEEKRTTR